MQRFINKYILLVIAIQFLTGCKFNLGGGSGTDCTQHLVTSHNVKIDSSFYKLFPYKSFDTLTFLYNFQDTVVFYGGSIFKYIITQFDNGYGDCGPDNKWNSDEWSVFFKSPIYRDSICIYITCGIYPSSATISVYFKQYNLNDFNSDDFKKPNTVSILIAGKYYKNIVYNSNNNNNQTYYSNELGLMKFKFSNGETWELIKK